MKLVYDFVKNWKKKWADYPLVGPDFFIGSDVYDAKTTKPWKYHQNICHCSTQLLMRSGCQCGNI